MGQAKRRKEYFAGTTPEHRQMVRMGIDPQHPEFAIARRIFSNMQLKWFLRKLEPENQRIAYDKLKPLLLFEVQDFEVLTAPDA